MLNTATQSRMTVATAIACGGAVELGRPVRLRFATGGGVGLRRWIHQAGAQQDDSLARLLAHCSPAPLGRGSETRHRHLMREPHRLEAAGGAFTVTGFDPASSGVLDQIREALSPRDARPLTAGLYAVNVFQSSEHFESYVEVPPDGEGLGTLAICLPWRFGAGALVVERGDETARFDWSRDLDAQLGDFTLHWAAFFDAEVRHHVEKVSWGHRVTLIYRLRQAEQPPAPRPVAAPRKPPKPPKPRAPRPQRAAPAQGGTALIGTLLREHEAQMKLLQRAMQKMLRKRK